MLIQGCSQYLETLCDLLYDDLRPRILHEPRLTVLCEVCTVLQALMVLDASTDNENGDEDDENSTKGSSDDDDNLPSKSNSDEKTYGKLGHRLQISHLLKMVLQDAQTRLFFKAQSVIQSDIRHFVPNADDLAYPDVLVGMYFSYQERKGIDFLFGQLRMESQRVQK